MNSFSPVADGFRHVLRRPAVFLAEIAWRWSFAAAAGLLIPLFLIEYLDTLPVTGLDHLLLASNQPIFIARALRRIFEGSAFRFTEAGILLMIGLAVAWVALASLGRLVIVSSLQKQFETGWSDKHRQCLRSVAGLNALRFVLTLAAILGTSGAALFASSTFASSNWASTRIGVADAARLFGLVLFLVWLTWIGLNWLLSTAAPLAVIEQDGALPAITSVLRLCQQQTGPMVVTGLVFGFIHAGIFVAATGAGLAVFVLGRILGMGPTVVLELALIAGYSGVIDFLYVSRLAAYMSMLNCDPTGEIEVRGTIPRIGLSETRSRVDPDELILSDVVVPAT